MEQTEKNTGRMSIEGWTNCHTFVGENETGGRAVASWHEETIYNALEHGAWQQTTEGREFAWLCAKFRPMV